MLSKDKKPNNEKKKFYLPAPHESIVFEAFRAVRGNGYVGMDISGNIRDMNDKAKEILGYDHTKESVNARRLIYKEDFAYALQSFAKLCKKGELQKYDARVITKNGTIKRVHIDTKIIYNTDHKPIGAHGIITEIFDKKQQIKK